MSWSDKPGIILKDSTRVWLVVKNKSKIFPPLLGSRTICIRLKSFRFSLKPSYNLVRVQRGLMKGKSDYLHHMFYLIARRLRAKIVLFRIQAWNFQHLLRLGSWWFLDIEPHRQISPEHAQVKIHFRYRTFGLTWLYWPVYALNMVENLPLYLCMSKRHIQIYFKIFP